MGERRPSRHMLDRVAREQDLPRLTGSVVLVPVKSFAQAKERLAPSLDPRRRAELAKVMADQVLEAADPLPVAVVCDDEEVAKWAASRCAIVLSEPRRGLNGAVEAGVKALGEAGADEIIVAHSDLPFARGLARLCGFSGVTLVPDRRRDGTNVICLPGRLAFGFAYGPGSFRRHVVEVRRLCLALRIIREPDLAWDVDIPSDIPAVLGHFT